MQPSITVIPPSPRRSASPPPSPFQFAVPSRSASPPAFSPPSPPRPPSRQRQRELESPPSPPRRTPRKPVPPGPIPALPLDTPLPSSARPGASPTLPSPPRPPSPPMPATYWSAAPTPRDLRECLTRYVFPALPCAPSTPLTGPDVVRALDLLHVRTRAAEFKSPSTRLRVQYHRGLAGVLLRQFSRLASPDPEDIATGRLSKSYLRSIEEWCARSAEAHASHLHASSNERAAADAGYAALVDPINDLAAHKSSYAPGRRPLAAPHWAWPPPGDASGPTDWVAYASDTPQAVCKWKQVSDEEMATLAGAARGPTTDKWPLDVLPGFSVWLEAGEVRNDAGMEGNPVTASLLAWSDAHHYFARWSVLFNGRSALVFFLAKPDQLFVSDVIPHDAGCAAGDTLTIAGVLFALCVLEPADRPTVSMADEVLRFYPPPCQRFLASIQDEDEGEDGKKETDEVVGKSQVKVPATLLKKKGGAKGPK